jgi:ABC-type branched-subunit amino acid transport system ATPase component
MLTVAGVSKRFGGIAALDDGQSQRAAKARSMA